MLTIVLRILSILGILLLALSALAVTIFLLVLFVPITYRISGAKDEEGFRISGKIKWLLGFFRLRYGYPEPGELTAKVLFFTVYRMKIPPDAEGDDSSKGDTEESGKTKIPARKSKAALRKKKDSPESGKKSAASKKKASGTDKGRDENVAEAGRSRPQPVGADEKTAVGTGAEASEPNTREAVAGREAFNQENPSMKAATEQTPEGNQSTDAATEQSPEGNQSTDAATKQSPEGNQSTDAAAEETAEENLSGIGKILQKFRKIQYTIHGIYDKIKEIWNNISYYLELLREEETRQLFSHIRLRTGKIIKSVWPGHIRADILFGTGSPDTTGYLYGAYCMLSPMLRADICVTPDFEEAVLRADFDISGHITLWVLAVNGCRIALDKRLRRLIKKALPPKAKAARKKAA